ncbi:zinc transport system substrate-binding protein [Devosia crocina]|uniref:Zinc transport system substrate-binding protein n=1 Tax=Devosia crocina TaxID=429728 RepID=A0A1I7NV55_9HYPH|nr:ZinT/AdcA family metal-binding protein [Devosia crocina]SFV38546.1 zinc transport system substrate-binding protein [Devosia crocina]
MLRYLAYSTALGLVLSGGALAQEHDHHHDATDVTLYRVFVGDHADAKVTAFDLDQPANRWTFDTTGQSKLYTVDNGGAVVAVQSDDDAVTFFQSGISLHAHGDHSDISVSDPAAIEDTLTGPRPFHLIDHAGKVVINFDRGGYAAIIDAHELSHGELESTQLQQARAHHGYAAPIGDLWVTSVASDAPVEGDAAPSRIGLQAVNADGTPAGDVATCTAIHGEAFSGAYLATGCAEGVLTVTDGADGPVMEMLEYPSDLPAGQSTGTLLGSKAMQVFLGNYGANGLVVVDPVDEPHFRYIELPFRRVDFALDPANARYGYVLTEDGSLHQLDMLQAQITQSVRVTEPYSMDGHWNDARPRIAMAGDELVMSDPNAGLVRRISTETLEEVGTIDVDGQPYNIAVAGGSGVDHGAEGGDHDHDGHSHDHGHDHGDEAHDHDHAHAHGDEAHDHGHDHAHGHDHNDQVYQGYFEDSQIADRTLADWEGDWQSVYPLLQDGTLDPVMEHKAEAGTMTADEYRAYYDVGYRTDVDRITIAGDTFIFYASGEPMEARYEADGYEVLTYEKGNRGVRFIFEKVEGDEAAPQFVQFSDHAIAPQDAHHFHLYWGDDRAALLEELTNWPTYYPSELSAAEVVEEMLAH